MEGTNIQIQSLPSVSLWINTASIYSPKSQFCNHPSREWCYTKKGDLRAVLILDEVKIAKHLFLYL
jgi:hypothetical protein